MIRNALVYGDNLGALRERVADGSVDLVYLDPPFNSNASYNVLFRERTGEESPAQIQAFTDTWHWTQEAERTLAQEILGNPDVSGSVKGMVSAFLDTIGRNDLMAYLVMMAPRLVELRRVLKPSGSIYLHCDSTAGHYLKLLMDTVFGKTNYRSAITWKRTSSHNDVRRNYADLSDNILFYSAGDKYVFHTQYLPYSQQHIERSYRNIDENGRQYSLTNLRSPSPRPNLTYDYKGYKPHHNGWSVSLERMRQLDSEGRLYFPKNKNGRIRLKRYLDEMPGVPLGNVWDDINPVPSQSRERLDYQTQKPEALLERIIASSSNEGDVVLDPFCGCGTAVVAAHKLNRQWLGIDITHLAVALMKNRLAAAFGLAAGRDYDVAGEPEDVGGARALWEQDPYQFQYWAVSLLQAQPQEKPKRGPDRGIDGMLHFLDGPRRSAHRAVVQVKGGRVSAPQVRDLRGVVAREGAAMGLFISLEPATRDMRQEAVSAGFYHSDLWGRDFPKIQLRTVGEMLSGEGFDLPPGLGYPAPQRARRAPGRQGALGESGA